MVSRKDIQAEKKRTYAGIRQANRQLLELIYDEKAKSGLCPLPHEAVRILWKVVWMMVYGEKTFFEFCEWYKARSEHLLSDSLPGAVSVSLYQDSYHDAVDVSLRYRPDIKLKKGKPGRPETSVEEIKRFVELHKSKSWGQMGKDELKDQLKAVPEAKAKELIFLKGESIRAALRRRTPRTK